MDLPFDQVLQAVHGQTFGGAINSILLALILLNIRSLKLAILRLEGDHDKRISKLEYGVAQLENAKG